MNAKKEKPLPIPVVSSKNCASLKGATIVALQNGGFRIVASDCKPEAFVNAPIVNARQLIEILRGLK